ncbi:hypothetical protein RYX36_019189 [Vicia faba]
MHKTEKSSGNGFINHQEYQKLQVHTTTILKNYGYEGLILCGDSGMPKIMKVFNFDDPYNTELGPGWDDFYRCNKFDAGERIIFRFNVSSRIKICHVYRFPYYG